MNALEHAAGLTSLTFDNRFIRELPGDPVAENHRRQVVGACHSSVQPKAVIRPQLVAFASEVAELLNLSEQDCTSPSFREIFVGNQQLPGMQPYATCYGGHQFGNWAGQLGDGRAINLGEIINHAGDRWALQLKGAGPTPYSRTADGLAVLRSSLREFVCSEAMYHLGVPTTRALSLILSGEEVLRDMLYDGNARHEPGAVVCRVAPSFTRFGHFQIFAAQGDARVLQQLVDYTITTDFAHHDWAQQLRDQPDSATRKSIYLKWFSEVIRLTAHLIVEWTRVGFVHGVMNTDNMSILGLTIDFGPYGWLENYDPDWTPNTTDAAGRRYRFGQQSQIALWNLVQLANAIYPLIDEVAPLEAALDSYRQSYERGWQHMMAAKLGLDEFRAADDQSLIDDLFSLLAAVETDMTLFFRGLGELAVERFSAADNAIPAALEEAYYVPAQLDDAYRSHLHHWLGRYARRIAQSGTGDEQRRAAMHAVNPRYVFRNYLAQLAIDEVEAGNFTAVDELLMVLRNPYTDQPGYDRHAARRPDWARHRVGCSMLSCSS